MSGIYAFFSKAGSGFRWVFDHNRNRFNKQQSCSPQATIQNQIYLLQIAFQAIMKRRMLKIDPVNFSDRTQCVPVSVFLNDASIARTIVTLAKILELEAIAEDVKTRGQLEMLREMKCDQTQGYLFS